MGNQVSLQLSFNVVSSGGLPLLTIKPTDSLTTTGTNLIGNVQTIGTSAEAIALSEVTTIGYVLVINLDPTNYVEIDNESGMAGWPQKLLAGDFILLKPQAATIYGKANTAACDVFIAAIEL